MYLADAHFLSTDQELRFTNFFPSLKTKINENKQKNVPLFHNLPTKIARSYQPGSRVCKVIVWMLIVKC